MYWGRYERGLTVHTHRYTDMHRHTDTDAHTCQLVRQVRENPRHPVAGSWPKFSRLSSRLWLRPSFGGQEADAELPGRDDPGRWGLGEEWWDCPAQ